MQLIATTALVCLALLSPATVSDADDDTGASHVISHVTRLYRYASNFVCMDIL